jgi:uncharacterized phiE125 gp8 family phage protein
MSLTLVTPPSREPLDADDLRKHLKIDDTIEDAALVRLCRVVRMRGERATRRAFLTQVWDNFLDGWPQWDGYHGGQATEPATTHLPAGGYVELPKAPLQSITFVKYTDLAGVEQTWPTTEYLVDAPAGEYCRRGRLSLGWVKTWPIVRPTANCIQIRQVCGYGDTPEDVPDILLQAMLMDAATLFTIRGSILAGTRAAAIEIPSTTRDIYLSFRSL